MKQNRIPLEELAQLPSFAVVTPSWDGQKIAFYWDKTGRYELYTLDLLSREVKKLTDGQAPRQLRAGFVWTRDDAEIIFAKDKDGDEQNNLFKLALASGQVVQMTDSPTTQEYAGEVHPDNTRLAVMSNRAGQMNVFTLDLKHETHEWKQLTHFKAPASAVGWSPDGEWLAFTSNESPNLQNQDGYLVREDGSKIRKILLLCCKVCDNGARWVINAPQDLLAGRVKQPSHERACTCRLRESSTPRPKRSFPSTATPIAPRNTPSPNWPPALCCASTSR